MEQVENTAELRSQNKKKIISYLCNHPSSTRRQISDDTGLSFATVSNLTSQMVYDSVLISKMANKSQGGRIPAYVSINPIGCFTLCIDLSCKQKVSVIVANLLGDIVYRAETENIENVSYETMTGNYIRVAGKLLDENEIVASELIGICLSVPGIWDTTHEMLVNSTDSRLENRHLVKDIHKYFPLLPCFIANEANLLAIASAIQYRDKGSQHSIFLYVDEGLGVGVINDGKILTGAHGFGGEISHWKMSGNKGYLCKCGQKGCLETELSVSGILHKLNESSIDNQLSEWVEFVKLVKQNDPHALAVVHDTSKLIANLISALNMMFDPALYFLGGRISDIYDEMIDEIQAVSSNETHSYSCPPILCASEREKLIVKGCEVIVFDGWKP